MTATLYASVYKFTACLVRKSLKTVFLIRLLSAHDQHFPTAFLSYHGMKGLIAAAVPLMAVLVFALVPAVSSASPVSPLVLPGRLTPARNLCPGENIRIIQGRDAAIRAMLCLTNFARRQVGRRSFSGNIKLGNSASSKAADILRCNSFSHTACRQPFTRRIKRSYVGSATCWRAAENIAWGSATLGTPREIFKAWIRSPGHRSAILSRQYRDIGIGFRIGTLQNRTSTRVWVQHFGRIC